MSKRSHNVRIDEDLWAVARRAAAAEGRTITDVVEAALQDLAWRWQPIERLEARLDAMEARPQSDTDPGATSGPS
ncbi:MAG TPA: hypothetical protein VF317_12835 [Dermatophilaceae bacterium]